MEDAPAQANPGIEGTPASASLGRVGYTGQRGLDGIFLQIALFG